MKWNPELELEVCQEAGAMRATLRADQGRRLVDFLTARRVESIYSLVGERLTVYICTDDLEAADDLLGQWLRARQATARFSAGTEDTLLVAKKRMTQQAAGG